MQAFDCWGDGPSTEYGWADKAAAPADEANILGGPNPNPGIASACLASFQGCRASQACQALHPSTWSDGRQLFPLPQSQCSGLSGLNQDE